MPSPEELRTVERPSSWRSNLDAASSVAMILAAGALVYFAVIRQSPAKPAAAPIPIPSESQNIQDAFTRGNPNAHVAIIEYSEFQCPFCALFQRDTLPSLEREYIDSGRVLFAFRHFPLPMHSSAQRAAEAAVCAGRQGKFWEMHDLLFANQQHLAEADLKQYALSARVNSVQFETCLAGEATQAVQADVAHAKTLGFTGTPMFLIGRVESGGVRVRAIISGARPIGDFKAAIEGALGSK